MTAFSLAKLKKQAVEQNYACSTGYSQYFFRPASIYLFDAALFSTALCIALFDSTANCFCK